MPNQRPRAYGLLLILLLIVGLYFPAKERFIPLLQEIYFQQVTLRFVEKSNISDLTKNGVLWGATRPELPQSLFGIYDLQDLLSTPMKLVSFYLAWGDGPNHEFPFQVVENMSEAGFIPLITWEPWTSAFAFSSGKELQNSLPLFTSGKVEAYIRSFARAAAKHQKPIVLRLGHEMTNPQYSWSSWHGNTSKDFQKFYQYVVQIFRNEGAHNVLFMWTPFTLLDHDYYPGNSYVDCIGLDVFNYGTLAENSVWLDFYSLAKLQVDTYKQYQKTIFIAEVATTDAGGNKEDWIRDLFHTIKTKAIPEIQGVVLFDIPNGATNTGLPVDWSIHNKPRQQQ